MNAPTAQTPWPPRVWLALVAPVFFLGLCVSLASAWHHLVGGLDWAAANAAANHAPAVPVSVGFGMTALFTWMMARKDGLSLASLGWQRPTLGDVAVGVGAAAVLMAINAALLYPLVQRAQPSFDPTLGSLSLPAALWMMTIAAASEDTLFRGYAFTTLQARRGTVAATLITTMFYAPLGGGQGWALVLWAVYFGVVLCALRVWRRSLWTVSITHVLVALGPKVLSLM